MYLEGRTYRWQHRGELARSSDGYRVKGETPRPSAIGVSTPTFMDISSTTFAEGIR